MAKISSLPALAEADVDGTELTPVSKNGQNFGAPISYLGAAAAQAARLARDQAADLVLPSNIFIDEDQATAEGAVVEGVTYKLVDSASGIATVYLRTAAGSTELYSEVTRAALGAPDAASKIGAPDGGFVSDYLTFTTPQVDLAVGDGLADDTLEAQSFLDRGGNLTIPAGVILRVTDELRMTVPGTKLHGPGEIRMSGQMQNKSALVIESDDCEVRGVKFSNPDELRAQTEAEQFGVRIEGNRNTVAFCEFWKMQTSVAVVAYGEFYDNKILFNRLRDCLGAGDGPGDDISELGEDRGDGIADWGSRTLIIGNTIQAKAGEDCRAGIVSESLDFFAEDTGGMDNSSGTIITHNHILSSEDRTGRFRRCIHVEGMKRTIVEANIGRSWSWWGIVVQGNSDHSSVRGNILYNDLPAGDKTGAAWNPLRSGILFTITGGLNRGSAIEYNTIISTAPSCDGIAIDGGGGDGTAQDVSVIGNRVYALADMGLRSGIVFKDALGNVSISENRVIGDWNRNIDLADIGRADISSNVLDGGAIGISSVLGADQLTIEGNKLRNCSDGVVLVNVSSGTVASNTFGNVANGGGFEIYVDGAATGTIVIASNVDIDGSGQFLKAGANKYLIRGNTGFITDGRVSAAEIAVASSTINTFGKHAGLIVVNDADLAYVATGSAPTAAWRKIEDGTALVPV